MPQPYNYQLNAHDPAQGMLSALKFGQAYQQMQQGQAQAGQQAQLAGQRGRINEQTIQQNMFKIQEQRRVQQERADYSAQMTRFRDQAGIYYQQPKEEQTSEGLLQLSRLIPGQIQKEIQDKLASMPVERAEQYTQQAAQVYGLLSSPETAHLGIDRLTQLAGIYEASQDPEVAETGKAIRSMAESGVEAAKMQTVALLGETPAGQRMVYSINLANKSRREDASQAGKKALLKSRISATQARTEASKARIKLSGLRAEEIKAISPLKKKKIESEITKLMQDSLTRKKDRLAAGQSSLSQIDQLLDTAGKILKSPSVGEVLGRWDASSIGDFTRTEEAELDVIALIEAIKSQISMSRISEMTGVLTDKDIEVLQRASGNLDRMQSEAQFKDTLEDIVKVTKKSRIKVKEQYDAPADASISDLVDKHRTQ
jgi:hypothetical protein